MRNCFYFLMMMVLLIGCRSKDHIEESQVSEDVSEGFTIEVSKQEGSTQEDVSSDSCKKHGDCEKGFYCDSLSGYRCKKRCVPDDDKFYTVSRDCLGMDRICRADGRIKMLAKKLW